MAKSKPFSSILNLKETMMNMRKWVRTRASRTINTVIRRAYIMTAKRRLWASKAPIVVKELADNKAPLVFANHLNDITKRERERTQLMVLYWWKKLLSRLACLKTHLRMMTRIGKLRKITTITSNSQREGRLANVGSPMRTWSRIIMRYRKLLRNLLWSFQGILVSMLIKIS